MTDTTATQWMGDNAPTPLNPPEVLATKDSPTIAMLGSLQELSAALGIGRSHLQNSELDDFDDMLRQVQRHLYIIKADIASRSEEAVVAGKRIPRINDTLVNAVDGYVTQLEEQLGLKPDRFILEAGSLAATSLFYANEVTRRVERMLMTLLHQPSVSETLRPKIVKTQQYLNHLSYQLYLMGRVSNRRLGVAEESILTDADSGEVTVYTE